MHKKPNKVFFFSVIFSAVIALQISVSAFPFGDKGDGILDTFGANGASDFSKMTLPEVLGKLFYLFDTAKPAIEGADFTKLSDIGMNLGKIGFSLLEKSDMLEAGKMESLKSSLTHLKEVGTKMVQISQTKDISGAVELLTDCENTVRALKEIYPKSIIDEAMKFAKE